MKATAISVAIEDGSGFERIEAIRQEGGLDVSRL